MNFLLDFHGAGAPMPKEFICDESRALLNAAVLTYSSFSNIEQYADAMRNPNFSITRIRIDVAHFHRKYKVLLANVNRRVKAFYMAAVGQLLISQDLKEAEEIIKAIFIISKSETEGTLQNGLETKCCSKKKWLTGMITSENLYQLDCI